MTIEFRLLGDVEADMEGRLVDLGHARQRCVLVALLAEANRVVAVDELLVRVWGEHLPHRARGTLRSYLSRLRQILAPAVDVGIVRRSGGYVLSVDAGAVDLYRFRCITRQAREADDDESAAALMTQALGLWRGEAFAALDTPWVNATREALNAERLAAQLHRTDLALGLGQHAELLGGLSVAAAADPWNERLAGQLMLALYRCGRQADALALYQQMRHRLAEELGTDPSPPLRQLHRKILTADPAIAAPSSGTSVGPRDDPARRRRGVPVPYQLPASPSAFTGRVVELAELSRAMDARPDKATAVVISAISGGGGIGKTWLALRWANDNVDRYPDGQLYVNLRGFDPHGEPVATPVALRGFLDALGVDPGQVPPDADAQAALYRSLVAGKRMLIVLDNASDTEAVVPLLPGSATCAVLVTSRRQLASLVTAHGARPLALDVLSDVEARELLARHLGAQRLAADRSAVNVLLRTCAGLPLALGIVAARAALQPGLPLAALAAELDTEATRLDALDAGEVAVDLRAVLSCSVRALRAGSAAVFALLGLAPGPDIGVAAAASLAALPVADTRRRLRQLAAAHLVHEHMPGRYRMHDLVRLYAVELAVSGGSAQDGALHRLLDHYLHTAHRGALLLSPHRNPLVLTEAQPGVTVESLADLDQAMAWFTTEHRVLLATIRHAGGAGFDVHACQLPWTLATFFDRRGHWHDWVSVQHAALHAARRLADRPQQAQAERLLGEAYINSGDYDKAHAHLRRALDLFGEATDHAGHAHVEFDIAMMFDRQGRHHDALRHARRSLELYRAAGSTVNEAVALNAIGWYESQLGRHREAIAHCQRALDLSRESGSPYGQANSWDSLGYAHHHLGEYERAIECYQHALGFFRDMGDRHAEAIALNHLGDAQAAAGHTESAVEAWRTALGTFDQLGHSDADKVRAKLSAG